MGFFFSQNSLLKWFLQLCAAALSVSSSSQVMCMHPTKTSGVSWILPFPPVRYECHQGKLVPSLNVLWKSNVNTQNFLGVFLEHFDKPCLKLIAEQRSKQTNLLVCQELSKTVTQSGEILHKGFNSTMYVDQRIILHAYFTLQDVGICSDIKASCSLLFLSYCLYHAISSLFWAVCTNSTTQFAQLTRALHKGRLFSIYRSVLHFEQFKCSLRRIPHDCVFSQHPWLSADIWCLWLEVRPAEQPVMQTQPARWTESSRQ